MVVFVVNINLKTGESKVIDPTGIELSEADKDFLAKILAQEILRNLIKEGANQQNNPILHHSATEKESTCLYPAPKNLLLP